MKLNNLSAPIPNRKSAKRRGRGEGSGLGQQSGRGHKGQRAGSGYSEKIGFEGGQMPLQRRAPKYGFKNPFRVEYFPINLSVISKAVEEGKLGNEINTSDLLKAGLVKKNMQVKVLGVGEVSKALTIKADAFSKTAVEKIQSAGGSATPVNE